VSKKRLGVLTFHRCINYGSYWQARSLVAGLRERGWDAVLLDHHSEYVNRREWRCGLRPVLEAGSRYKAEYRQKVAAFQSEFCDMPLSEPFPLHEPEKMQPFDTIVVGSDEVWNLAHPWYGQCPLFYGDGLRAERLVAYAASFGNFAAGWQLHPWWAEKLQQFSSMSVRDLNSRRIVRNALGVQPSVTLDPCLQFSHPLEGAWRGPGGSYLAVYGHDFSEEFARRVQAFAKGRGLATVSIGYANEWADEQWIEAGPHDFAHFMARAEAVATNFFHGCVFALREGKPFACEAMPYRAIKVRDLLALVGASRHLSGQVEERLGESPRPEIRENIECLRDRSEAFLEAALGHG
jgi:hypothetical protein